MAAGRPTTVNAKSEEMRVEIIIAQLSPSDEKREYMKPLKSISSINAGAMA